jgi:MoxR-like ATPase
MVADIAARSRRSAGWVLTTATSDWTTYETIGGLRPTQEGLEFEEGHFLAAIRERKWLVIDELNRSNFDRAFGQLFTALSGQPVVLPYHRPDKDERLTIVPETEDGFLNLGGDQLVIPQSWRVLATINVFDKSLLFEMSYALMRRFAFVDVPSPTDEDFEQLIDDAATDESGVRDDVAAEVARSLLEVRTVKDIGPASYMDLARFVRRLREADASIDPAALRWRAFFSYLLPQFEGIDERDGRRLHAVLAGLVGPARQNDLKQTLATVLGLSAFAVAPPDRSAGEGDESE